MNEVETAPLIGIDNLLSKHGEALALPSDLVAKAQFRLSLWRGQPADCELLPSCCRTQTQKGRDPKEAEACLERLAQENLQGVFAHLQGKIRLWEVAAIAQHLGYPTPLLDWSRNPLIGLWFATKQSKGHEPRDAHLWHAYTTEPVQSEDEESVLPRSPYRTGDTSDNPNCEEYEVYETKAVNQRITAQQGMFISWKDRDQPFDQWMASYRTRCKDRLGEKAPPLQFRRYLIPAADKPIWRQRLIMAGLDERQVFPDAEGMRQWIKRFERETARDQFRQPSHSQPGDERV